MFYSSYTTAFRFLLIKEQHTFFYLFIDTFNVMERLQNKLVHGITYATV